MYMGKVVEGSNHVKGNRRGWLLVHGLFERVIPIHRMSLVKLFHISFKYTVHSCYMSLLLHLKKSVSY